MDSEQMLSIKAQLCTRRECKTFDLEDLLQLHSCALKLNNICSVPVVVSKFCWNVWSSNLSIFSRHCHVHRLPTQWTCFFQLPSTVQDPEYGSIYSFFLLQLAKRAESRAEAEKDIQKAQEQGKALINLSQQAKCMFAGCCQRIRGKILIQSNCVPACISGIVHLGHSSE